MESACKRDEQVGVEFARHLQALIEGDENIADARHLHVIPAACCQLLLKRLSDGENQRLLLEIAGAGSTRVNSAMAGVDEDNRLGALPLQRLRRRCGIGFGRAARLGRRRCPMPNDWTDVGASSMTSSTAVPPLPVMSARLMTTGPVVSMTTRALPSASNPKRNAAMSPLPLLSRSLGKMEGDVGQIDDDAIGVGEGENLSPHARRETQQKLGRSGCRRDLGALGDDGGALAMHAAWIARGGARDHSRTAHGQRRGAYGRPSGARPAPPAHHVADASPSPQPVEIIAPRPRTLTKPLPIFPQIADSWPAGSQRCLYNMLASLPANSYLLLRCCSGALSRTFVRRKSELNGQPSSRSRRFAAPREGRSRCRPTIEWFALRPQANAPGLYRRRSLEPEGQACARRDANRSRLPSITCIAPIFARERKAYGAGG